MYRRNGICKEAQKIGGKEIGRILCGNQTLDVAVDILFVQKRNKSYGSREVTLGKGKGKEEGKRCFLSLLLSPISQTYSLLPGALLIFPSLPLLPMRSCYAFLRQEKPVLVPSKELLGEIKATLLSPFIPAHAQRELFIAQSCCF